MQEANLALQEERIVVEREKGAIVSRLEEKCREFRSERFFSFNDGLC